MSLEYVIKSGNSQARALSPTQIMAQMNTALYGSNKQIISITPDGTTALVSQDGQSFEVPLEKLIRASGAELETVKPPTNMIDYSTVQNGWRYAISNLENDDQKKQYLQMKASEMGLPNAKVIGGGRDWYVYEPTSGQWAAVTNSPEWETADLMEAGTEAIRSVPAIGGAIGAGLLAAETGPGALLAAGAGGAGGAALGEAVSRGLAATDPAYRQAFDAGEAVIGAVPNVAISGIAPGVGKAVGAGVRSLVGPSVSRVVSAPVSSAARGAGAVTSGVGSVAKAAEIGASGPGKFVGSMLMPGLQSMGMFGAALQLPGLAMQAGKWLGSKLSGRPLQGTISESARKAGQVLGSKLGGRQAIAQGGKYGQQVGQAVETAQRGGEALIHGAEELFGAGARGVAAAGGGLQRVGAGLSSAGRALAPIEPKAMAPIAGQAVRQMGRTQSMPAAEEMMPMQAPAQMPVNYPRYDLPSMSPEGFYRAPLLRETPQFQQIQMLSNPASGYISQAALEI